MKVKLVSLFLFFIIPLTGYSQEDLIYYLPDNVEYDPNIPTPEEVIGHQVGEWHITHDKLVNYMVAVAEASDRVSIGEYARSYEDRPLLILTITSPENHEQIDQIKENQMALTDPNQSGNVDIENHPVVVNIGNSIHGNEPSGSNSSMLTAYYFAAAQGDRIEEILDEAVILLDPSFNPDGLNRFATWVNMHKSKTTVTDPADREYNERWPSGRTNHYWFDLNRDWMPVQHPESRGRVAKFHEWRPNILTDHHEMGSNSTFFFQPGIPSRTHPLTPQINQDLTAEISEFHAGALDEIQSLYYSKESFDDFYYGKGSTYPDLFGTIGILFEQASSRGHAQETDHGVLRFPFTIRNQFKTALSTVDAAVALRTDLHEYRKDSYRDVQEQASDSDTKAFVIGDQHDQGRNYHFADLLSKHNVELYELAEDLEVNGEEFKQGRAWVIPTNQTEYKFVKAMFETRTEFTDSLFYDVSTWTLPFAFNLPFKELENGQFEDMLGEQVKTPELPTGEMIGGESDYAYIFSWVEYYAPRALYRLQKKGIRTKVFQKPTTVQTPDGHKTFDYGSILVALGTQNVDPDEIYDILQTAAEEDGVDVYNVTTGLGVNGVDLGSPSTEALEKPSVAIIVGEGISSYDAGEVWHQFDQRYNIPLTMIDKDDFQSANLSRYNSIVMADGYYGELSEQSVTELKRWISNGGVLILMEDAIDWGISRELVNLTKKDDEERYQFSEDLTYVEIPDARGAQLIGGTIFEATIDITHPIGYGYNDTNIHIFRRGTQFYEQPDNHFSTPVSLTDDPLASGYISNYNAELIRNTPSVIVDNHGSGRIICFVDNPNFRAFWFGKNKLFANAIFFGQTISSASTN